MRAVKVAMPQEEKEALRTQEVAAKKAREVARSDEGRDAVRAYSQVKRDTKTWSSAEKAGFQSSAVKDATMIGLESIQP